MLNWPSLNQPISDNSPTLHARQITALLRFRGTGRKLDRWVANGFIKWYRLQCSTPFVSFGPLPLENHSWQQWHKNSERWVIVPYCLGLLAGLALIRGTTSSVWPSAGDAATTRRLTRPSSATQVLPLFQMRSWSPFCSVGPMNLNRLQLGAPPNLPAAAMPKVWCASLNANGWVDRSHILPTLGAPMICRIKNFGSRLWVSWVNNPPLLTASCHIGVDSSRKRA